MGAALGTSTHRAFGVAGSATSLRYHHCLGLQEAGTTHADRLVEAALLQQPTPLLPLHQRAMVPQALGVGRFVEEPPSIREAEGDLSKRAGTLCIVDQQQPARHQQLAAVAQRVTHEGRGVQGVGRDDEVVLRRGKALQPRVSINVEQLILDEWVLGGKGSACAAQEAFGHVREGVASAGTPQRRQYACRGAAGACANLQDPQKPPLGQRIDDGTHRSHDALVVEAGDHGVLVHRQHSVHRTAWEEQLLASKPQAWAGSEAWFEAGLLTSGHRSRCACSTSSRVTYGSDGGGCALHQFKSSWWCHRGTACPCNACSAACTYCWQSRSSNAYAAPSCTALCARVEASALVRRTACKDKPVELAGLTPHQHLWLGRRAQLQAPHRTALVPKLAGADGLREARCNRSTRPSAHAVEGQRGHLGADSPSETPQPGVPASLATHRCRSTGGHEPHWRGRELRRSELHHRERRSQPRQWAAAGRDENEVWLPHCVRYGRRRVDGRRRPQLDGSVVEHQGSRGAVRRQLIGERRPFGLVAPVTSGLRLCRLKNTADEPVEMRLAHAVAAAERHVCRVGARRRRHRPQHARRRSAHQHSVHRKRQPALGVAIAATPQKSGRLQRAVEVSRVHLCARQRGTPPQTRRRLAAGLPRRLQRAERGAVLQPSCRERSVERRCVGHVAAPLPRRREPQWPPRRRIRRRPLPAAVHRRRRLSTAAAHLERAALKQRALHPRRAPRLQRQRLQEEHSTQRRAHRRGRSHGGACRARRLQVGRAREDDAPTHDVVGHQRVQRAGHGRTEEGRAARGSRQPTQQQRMGRIGPQERASAKAERHTASHARRRRAARRALQHRVRDRAAVPERRHASQAKQVLFPRRDSHRCQLHGPKGHLPSPSSGGRDHWVEDEELCVANSYTA
eukprot:scaffold1950_cov72-Phaeocystis_antarctica.AAC.5